MIQNAVHNLLVARETGPGRLLDWRITALATQKNRAEDIAHRLGLGSPGPRRMCVLAVSQIVLATAGLVSPRNMWIFAGLFVIEVLTLPLIRTGLDGADEILRLVIIVSVLRNLSDSAIVQLAAAAFLGGQAALAYLTAGLSKTQSIMWWDSSGLRGIAATEYFGARPMARLLDRHTNTARLLSWTIVAWESLFALALLAPREITLAALAIGLVFHLSCAFGMGLDAFLLPFAATYPCVLVIQDWLSDHLSAVERTGIAGAAACAIIGFAAFNLGQERQIAWSAAMPETRSTITAPAGE
ncbi:hypothetical protein [Streptomyces sp. NRRL B-1347]|uniref:hypothetical protein n=1 Tax=Streptomyces sp. NRRL B-1347 TaxID=1476877 RepID=UPI00131E57E3|nr:hypothetical protein [Streptomyces sp. NRRL B-1347]